MQTPPEPDWIRLGRAIAALRGDLDGRLFPLFAHVDADRWLQPIPVYVIALWFSTGSWADLAARWPSAVIGALNVALVYLIARRLLQRIEWAVAAGALLLLAPAHFVYGRAAVDSIYVVPFVLAWMLLLAEFFDRPRAWLVAAATLWLGVGVYTQPSAPITMALYLTITAYSLWSHGHRSVGLYLGGAGAFALPLLGMAAWFIVHPETYQDTMGRWAIHAAHIRYPLDGVRALVNWNTLSNRTALYWEFFNPATLFFASAPGSGPEIMHGAAPLAMSMLLLVPVGVARLASSQSAMAPVLLGGLVCTPLAAVTFSDPHVMGRALTAVPLLTLLAAAGGATLLESKRVLVRSAAILLLALVPLQFLRFVHAY